MMKIYTMCIEDYEEVYNLWLSCEGMGLNNLDESKDGIARFLRRNPVTCFVAKNRERIVGVILAGNDGRRGYIYHVAVAADCRRKGIGTRLVECAVNALEQEGIHKVALLVFCHNDAGNAFWEKQGFKTREDIRYRNKELTTIVRIDT